MPPDAADDIYRIESEIATGGQAEGWNSIHYVY